MLQKIRNLFGKENQENQENQENKEKRTDAYANYKTGLGTEFSRTGNTYFAPAKTIHHKTLASLYRDNGIARRIVNILVEDAVRNFIEAEPELIEELGRLQVKQRLLDAGCFGRLYGGAIIVAFIDDGLDLDKQLNLNSVQRLVSLKVFDRHQVRWEIQDVSTDLYSEYFGEPEYYIVTKADRFITKDTASFRVHRSRCFLFGGASLPNRDRTENEGWDDSVLQACYDALKKYDIVTSAAAEMIQDFVQVIFKVKDLGVKLATDGGWSSVQNRLSIFNQTRSVVGAGFIDADGEDYEKRSSSVAGIDALWDRYSEFVCSVTGVPATKLFGKSPGGLNSTGASDLQIHYDNVRAYRTDQIEPALKWIISILEVQKKWLDKPDNFDWEFPSLTSPTEVEWADVKKKYAEIDAMYIDRGAIDPVECWQERFGQGVFNTNITLSKPDLEPLPSEIDPELDNIINNKEKNVNSEEKKVEKIIDVMFDRARTNINYE